MTRRDCLRTMGTGFGMLGLANLLSADFKQSPLEVKAWAFMSKAWAFEL